MSNGDAVQISQKWLCEL